MSQNDLKPLIERLREELNSGEPASPETREHLHGLLAELHQRLDNPREDNQDQDLIERVKQSIEQFETEHPRATAILNDIMVTLGNLGI